ncbi:hypothetical protein K1W54_04410 [Micromonospora sp. CPCC 205371]|nr:hypothetical protein [Micromonospora sp. CPCC 205371]
MTTAFIAEWNRARTRVLNRYARQATEDAAHLRARIDSFPEHTADLEGNAAALDDYAARCREAADDPTLPTPEYVGYQPKGTIAA